jgi:hypothetical protein
MAMIFKCMYEKLWTTLCLFDLRSQSLCDCLLDRTPFGASHLEDLTQKAALAQRTGKRSKIRFRNHMLERSNPVGINETVVRTDAPITRGFGGCLDYCYDRVVEIGFSGLQNRKTPHV